uniref:Spondin domain-containing protein n=1 Tax=Pseudo-nitzschia australis TaxID=44445 RepID=A0A7S4AKE4_9STRA|mmetsp:Transcript_19287/g.41944  ORF Transcript_19287/g.41944 Transcript_19287/m.41944 type:complete len:310 (+) Transcript_19287:102-1031(+)
MVATSSSSMSAAAVAATPAALLFLLLLVSPFVVLPVASQDATASSVASDAATETPSAVVGFGGCIDPVKGYEPVTIGKPTPVCLVLANNGDWSTEMTYMRLNFKPLADAYSRFHVPQSFGQLVSTEQNALTEIFTGNVTVHAESQTALSFQKLYYNGDDKVFPFLTAIINVHKGEVTGITWDDACVFCGSDECEDNTFRYDGEIATKEEARQPVGGCYNTVERCQSSKKAECDLILYVVWTGTDSKGRDMMSSANRFSAFPAQSWGDRLNLGMPNWMKDTSDWMKDIDVNPFDNDKADESNPSGGTNSN